MTRRSLWLLAKALEGIGLVLVLVGLVMSIMLGFEEEGLASMEFELKGLIAGGGLFLLGWLLERAVGTR